MKDDEWGTHCLQLSGGGYEACYIEFDFDNNKCRYNWPCKHTIEMINIKQLYTINFEGAQYITDKEPININYDTGVFTDIFESWGVFDVDDYVMDK